MAARKRDPLEGAGEGRASPAARSLAALRRSGLLDLQFLLALGLMTAAFLVQRLPRQLYFPWPDASPDTWWYFEIVDRIRSGRLPTFEMRTPGYPLFILACLKLTGSAWGIIVIQNLLTWLSSAIMIRCVHLVWRRLTLLAGLGMACLVLRNYSLMHDLRLYADSLYASLIVTGFALLIPAFARRSAWLLGVVAFLFSCAVLVRPAGMFLAPVLLLVLAYAAWNRWGRRLLVAISVPFVLPLLFLAVYNRCTIGLFTISPWGHMAMAGVVLSWIEPDDSYPPEFNERIVKIRDSISPSDRALFRDSWDLVQLNERFRAIYDRQFEILPPGEDSYLRYMGWIRDMNRKALKRHPELYAKFVTSMLREYFLTNPMNDSMGYLLSHMNQRIGILKGIAVHQGFKDAFRSPEDERPAVTFAEDGSTRLSWVVELSNYLYFRLLPLFRNAGVPLVLFVLLGYSAFCCWRGRFRDDVAFLGLLFALANIGAGIMICLVNMSLFRFSYLMEFVNYLAPVLLLAMAPAGLKEAALGFLRALAPAPRRHAVFLAATAVALAAVACLDRAYFLAGPQIRQCDGSWYLACGRMFEPQHEAYNALGSQLVDLGQPRAAAHCFWEARLRAPNIPVYQNNLVIALVKSGQVDAAVAAGESLLAQQPDNQPLRQFLFGWNLDRAQQAIQADDDMEAARRLARAFTLDGSRLDGVAMERWNAMRNSLLSGKNLRVLRIEQEMQAMISSANKQP